MRLNTTCWICTGLAMTRQSGNPCRPDMYAALRGVDRRQGGDFFQNICDWHCIQLIAVGLGEIAQMMDNLARSQDLLRRAVHRLRIIDLFAESLASSSR